LSVVDGLTARAVSEIQALERSGMSPGAVGRALAEWKRAVHQNVARLLEEAAQHGCPCCDPAEARDLLEQTLATLSPRTRQALLAKVEPLDEMFRRRTVHDPQTPLEWPWWRRRA
jgi:hypothetical protein